MLIQLQKKNCSCIYRAKHQSLCLLICYLFTCSPITGQTVSIKGCIGIHDSPDIVYNIVALRSDSSIYKGQIYTDRTFLFEVNCDSIICIQFSSLGYESLSYNRNKIALFIDNQTVQLGEIPLKSSLILDEATVNAHKKNFIISSSGFSINVRNSYLASYGTFSDIIKRVPGVMLTPRGGIEVIGKSNPLFVLNGRRLTSSADLERLDPKIIKTIYVDQNPGPQYDAVYDAVVRIETIDYNSEFYSADLRNSFEHGRRPSNSSRIILQRKIKNFVYGVEARYNIPQYKQYDSEEKTVWIDTNSVSTCRNATLTGKDKNILLNPSIEWVIDKKNKLEAIYRFTHQNNQFNSDQNYIATTVNKKELIDTYLTQHEKKNGHNPSLSYIYDNKVDRFQLSVDYYVMHTNDNQKVAEASIDNETHLTQDFTDKYEILGAAIDYEKKIKTWKLNSGTKFSSIKDAGKYNTVDQALSTSLLKDNAYALYLGAAKSTSLLSFSAALRAEWNDINYGNSSNTKIVTSNYFNLFPTASVKYTNNQFTVSLSYNKRIRRPTFSQLNPNKRYLDPISYMVGNPLLKSRIMQDLTLSTQYADLIFRAIYTVQYNPLAGILELTPDNKVAFINTNIPKTKSIDLFAIYSFNKSWFKSNFSLQARFQDIRFQDKIYSKFADAPGIKSKVNIDFNAWKNGNFSLMGYYMANYKMDVSKFKNSGYLSLELNLHFFTSQLILTTGVSDIFRHFRPNTWESHLPNATLKMDSGDGDSRSFYITLQYKIGKMKDTKKTSIISDEKNRL